MYTTLLIHTESILTSEGVDAGLGIVLPSANCTLVLTVDRARGRGRAKEKKKGAYHFPKQKATTGYTPTLSQYSVATRPCIFVAHHFPG